MSKKTELLDEMLEAAAEYGEAHFLLDGLRGMEGRLSDASEENNRGHIRDTEEDLVAARVKFANALDAYIGHELRVVRVIDVASGGTGVLSHKSIRPVPEELR
jgi:hypothetical protein